MLHIFIWKRKWITFLSNPHSGGLSIMNPTVLNLNFHYRQMFFNLCYQINDWIIMNYCFFIINCFNIIFFHEFRDSEKLDHLSLKIFQNFFFMYDILLPERLEWTIFLSILYLIHHYQVLHLLFYVWYIIARTVGVNNILYLIHHYQVLHIFYIKKKLKMKMKTRNK